MRVTMTCAIVGALLALSGCAAPENPPADPAPESHTMPDGTVMDGQTHTHGDSHDHGPGETAAGPSAAARMICAGDVVDDVTRIMDAPAEVSPTSSWQAPIFTCRFDLDAGTLTLSVHDASDTASGMAHFQNERISSTDAAPIRGVYSLGLPAYETKAGIVSFVKDGKTLEVDATGLNGERRLGVENTKTRSEIAYAVATSVLACWTQHG